MFDMGSNYCSSYEFIMLNNDKFLYQFQQNVHFREFRILSQFFFVDFITFVAAFKYAFFMFYIK